jgi:hypothetical protein
MRRADLGLQGDGEEWWFGVLGCDNAPVSGDPPDGEQHLADGESWSVTPIGRIWTGVVFVGLGLVALIDTAARDLPITDPLPLIVVLTALWWFGAMRPAVQLTADKLVIRNPFWTRRIARTDVLSARPGYLGLVIRRRSGLPCIAWAIQKANASEWAGAETRADQAAGRITEWAQTRETLRADGPGLAG